MAVNVELRRKKNNSFDDADSILHPITKPANLVGFLENNKIKESWLPASVFNGLRFVNELSANISTGAVDSTGTLAEQIDTYLDNNGGSANGLYFIATQALTLTATSANSFSTSFGGSSEEEGVESSTITVETNDWILCTGTDNSDPAEYVFSILNNEYRLATDNHDGLMTAADHEKLDGIEAGANAYTHDTFTSRNIDASGIEVLDVLSVNGEGHVTNATLRSIQDATTTQKGVTQLALDTDYNTGTFTSDKVPAVNVTKDMIDYFTGNSLYSDTTAADTADHPNGAIVLVEASVE